MTAIVTLISLENILSDDPSNSQVAIAWATALFEASSILLMFALIYLFLLSLVALGLALSALFTKVGRLMEKSKNRLNWAAQKVLGSDSLACTVYTISSV